VDDAVAQEHTEFAPDPALALRKAHRAAEQADAQEQQDDHRATWAIMPDGDTYRIERDGVVVKRGILTPERAAELMHYLVRGLVDSDVVDAPEGGE